jgi:DNA-binding response OmpR family regulator
MFTVKSELRDKVHAMQDGALDFITKPFGYDELLGRIGRIFEGLEVRQ